MPLGLKKCPLCGSDDIKKKDSILKYVECNKCGFKTSTIHCDTIEEAISKWNKRNHSYKKYRLCSRRDYDIYVKDCPLCVQNPDAPEKSIYLMCYDDKYWVVCTHCDAETGAYKTKEEAIDAWNTRAMEE